MFIDCHTHAFSDKIADRAVEQLINYYHIQTNWGGRLKDLINAANEVKLDALILLVAATKPEQLKPANDWMLTLSKQKPEEIQNELGVSRIPRIIPFGTFHPQHQDWESEIERLHRAGIKGIKLHPEFQGIDLADPVMNRFYEAIAGRFILMIHVGDPTKTLNNLSTPNKVANILKNFPKVQIIAAHLGGYCFWEEALDTLTGKDIYLDTSSAIEYIDSRLLQQIVSKHGIEHILFGSDYPLRSPGQELLQLDRIKGLTISDKEKILGENCRRLLQI